MNNFPRQVLRRITDKYGKEIGVDARRCQAILNDLCGDYRREINALVNAVDEGIPADLLAGAAGSLPTELLLARLERRLENHTALTVEAARWAVASWALALKVCTEAEIEERERSQFSQPSPKAETNQPAGAKNKSADQDVSGINPVNPAAATAKQPAPPTQPSTSPSPGRSANQTPPHHPPPVFLPQNQPPLHDPTLNPPVRGSSPTVVPKNRFGILRGCLIIVFLFSLAAAALLFGVPYAIEVMRQTQREKSLEPPRFPTR